MLGVGGRWYIYEYLLRSHLRDRQIVASYDKHGDWRPSLIRIPSGVAEESR